MCILFTPKYTAATLIPTRYQFTGNDRVRDGESGEGHALTGAGADHIDGHIGAEARGDGSRLRWLLGQAFFYSGPFRRSESVGVPFPE